MSYQLSTAANCIFLHLGWLKKQGRVKNSGSSNLNNTKQFLSTKSDLPVFGRFESLFWQHLCIRSFFSINFLELFDKSPVNLDVMYRFCVKFIFFWLCKNVHQSNIHQVRINSCLQPYLYIIQHTCTICKADSLYSHAIKVIMLEETQYIMFVSR